MTLYSPVQAVDVAQEVYGAHPGARALHAKGILTQGSFLATPAARWLSAAAHLQGEPVPVVARFSFGTGDPGHSDSLPGPRGLAVKFTLPDGTKTDIVAITTPAFPVSTPDDFVTLIRLQAGRPGALRELPGLLARNPRLPSALARSAPGLRPPASYATVPYHAIHAFRLLDATGASRFVRYRLLNEGPAAFLGLRDARRRGPDFLRTELTERLAAGPVRFTLEAQIAAAGDSVEDPSRAWPAARERVALGTVTLTGLETSRERDGDVLVFDPTRVTPGIECSTDPVLLYRSPAYRESVRRRTAPA